MIFHYDRASNMLRTVVNVTGDATVASVIGNGYEKEQGEGAKAKRVVVLGDECSKVLVRNR